VLQKGQVALTLRGISHIISNRHFYRSVRMVNLYYYIDLILHFDTYLIALINKHGLLIYLLLFFMLFSETGFVVTPLVPGDIVLFTTGALATTGSLNISALFFVLCLAVVSGDNSNYFIGHLVRKKITKNEDIRFIKKEYLDHTRRFFKRYGARTIIIASFLPIVRTLAPFVAGMGFIPYSKFFWYNVVGVVSWVSIFLFAGYFFGNLPIVKDNFSLAILVIFLVSSFFGIITYIQSKRKSKMHD
jgi:membrane-associated protein